MGVSAGCFSAIVRVFFECFSLSLGDPDKSEFSAHTKIRMFECLCGWVCLFW